ERPKFNNQGLTKMWVHGSSVAGKGKLLFTVFVVFSGVHAFAAKCGSGLKAERNKSLRQSPGALGSV
ncbi:MAG: hypothetical protein WKF68_12885, partial [Daejeonella sp.]